MAQRTVRKPFSVEIEGRRVDFAIGAKLVVGEDRSLRRLEDWLTDTGRITTAHGGHSVVHDKCIELCDYQMLHAADCLEPEVWR